MPLAAAGTFCDASVGAGIVAAAPPGPSAQAETIARHAASASVAARARGLRRGWRRVKGHSFLRKIGQPRCGQSSFAQPADRVLLAGAPVPGTLHKRYQSIRP
ncbi:hypothetical protein GCM10023081_29700 [Arthrobacter ginkgonis]|uniref:Uncharacterized protein n=1 Tax=Arthrobacter ginkgonis TaxID=1630594 RepID=A0ABP7CKZ9_9MICC